MTPAQAEAALLEVERHAGDPEKAHFLEDDMRETVLRHIANGGSNARKLARIALRTRDIAFGRWCA